MRSRLLLVFLLAAAGSAPEAREEATLFAEGVVSTADDESGFALSPDGQTAFFGKTSPVTTGDPMQVLCVTHLQPNGRWGEPEFATFSGRFHDLGPAFQPDGSRLFFISNRPRKPEGHDYNIWYVERSGSGWSEPHALPEPVNSTGDEVGVSVGADGTLYFASNRHGGIGSFDIYRSRPENGEYKTVESLGEPVNTKGPELEPAISPDGNILVFAALGRDDETPGIHREYARGDLYISFRTQTGWAAPRNCGRPINSGSEESWPGFSSDGRRFFFSSERGFATYRLASGMQWRELERVLRSTRNGLGNIYEVDASLIGTSDLSGRP